MLSMVHGSNAASEACLIPHFAGPQLCPGVVGAPPTSSVAHRALHLVRVAAPLRVRAAAPGIKCTCSRLWLLPARGTTRPPQLVRPPPLCAAALVLHTLHPTSSSSSASLGPRVAHHSAQIPFAQAQRNPSNYGAGQHTNPPTRRTPAMADAALQVDSATTAAGTLEARNVLQGAHGPCALRQHSHPWPAHEACLWPLLSHPWTPAPLSVLVYPGPRPVLSYLPTFPALPPLNAPGAAVWRFHAPAAPTACRGRTGRAPACAGPGPSCRGPCQQPAPGCPAGPVLRAGCCGTRCAPGRGGGASSGGGEPACFSLCFCPAAFTAAAVC